MTNKSNVWKILSIIFIMVSIILLGILVYKNYSVCPECPEIEEPIEKAMLSVDMYTWGFNKYDDSELLFDYWINNYGNLEAKNVKVRCKLVSDIVTAFSGVDYYGNLASKSTALGEFLPKKPSSFNISKEYSGFCYVESCDNCEILYKKIPSLIESYES